MQNQIRTCRKQRNEFRAKTTEVKDLPQGKQRKGTENERAKRVKEHG